MCAGQWRRDLTFRIYEFRKGWSGWCTFQKKNSSHFVPKEEFVKNYAFSFSFLCLSTQFPKFKVVVAYIQCFGFQTTDFNTNQTCVVVGGVFLALCRNMNMYPILRVHRDVTIYGKRGVLVASLVRESLSGCNRASSGSFRQ